LDSVILDSSIPQLESCLSTPVAAGILAATHRRSKSISVPSLTNASKEQLHKMIVALKKELIQAHFIQQKLVRRFYIQSRTMANFKSLVVLGVVMITLLVLGWISPFFSE